MYKETCNFIFNNTSMRIKQKKNVLKRTWYEVMGFKDKDGYLNSDHYYDYNMVSKISNGKRNKNNKYLLTDKYAYILKEGLSFDSYHELYWGTDQEIEAYCEQLFYLLLKDIPSKTTNFYLNLCEFLETLTPKEIYNTIKLNFIEEFKMFTRGEFKDKFEIVDDQESAGLTNFLHELKFVVDGTLTYKKLPENLDRFVSDEFLPLLNSSWLQELSNSQIEDSSSEGKKFDSTNLPELLLRRLKAKQKKV